MSDSCEHLDEAGERQGVTPSGPGCQECLQAHGIWVHLRLCLTCGHVGCCDNSPGRHGTKHFRQSQHPVIRSCEPGEDWGYCFPHELFVEALPARPGEVPPRHFNPPHPKRLSP